MRQFAGVKVSGAIGAVLALVVSMIAFSGIAAQADVPDPPSAAEFTAPLCPGSTAFDPTQNAGAPVLDLTSVFGERLVTYNAGGIVPLYDAFGGSVLLGPTGTVQSEAAYPPMCGTRYVASVGHAVSEWMFCTDRLSQSCGDTNGAGGLVDHDGSPIAPMTSLARNPRLDSDQEKLIAYLIQNGHAYQGVGDQSWSGATRAVSDGTTDERAALQTLIWCISDPATDASDFATTCDANIDAGEQARLLRMIPDAPSLEIALSSPTTPVAVGDTARLAIATNILNQPIQLAIGGSAADVAVCSGPATLSAGVLTVAGTDPTATTTIELCAVPSEAGTVTVDASATPPSTSHIGWSQSVNPLLTVPCQVYGTFHETQELRIDATGRLQVHADATSGTATDTPATLSGAELAATGGAANLGALWLGLGLLGFGGAAALRRVRHPRRDS